MTRRIQPGARLRDCPCVCSPLIRWRAWQHPRLTILKTPFGGDEGQMSVTAGSLGTADVSASHPSLHGLDGVTFSLLQHWLARNGYDFGHRFRLIAKAIAALPVKSCFIDGEAIVVNSMGLSVFDLLRYRQHDGAAVLCAFDLIELEGKDLRPSPIEQRKDQLGKLLRSVRHSHTGIRLNEHYEGDGATIYRHGCRFGCEGHRLEMARLPVRFRPGQSWAQDQESGRAGREARGRGGLGRQAMGARAASREMIYHHYSRYRLADQSAGD